MTIADILRLLPFRRAAAHGEVAYANASLGRAPLTVAQQWSRLASVLESAISGAANAGRRQAAATQQLDLAQYGLSTLGDELAAVMHVPGRRERATVHPFERPAAKPEKAKSLAA